jgi:hypothetical protein
LTKRREDWTVIPNLVDFDKTKTTFSWHPRGNCWMDCPACHARSEVLLACRILPATSQTGRGPIEGGAGNPTPCFRAMLDPILLIRPEIAADSLVGPSTSLQAGL